VTKFRDVAVDSDTVNLNVPFSESTTSVRYMLLVRWKKICNQEKQVECNKEQFSEGLRHSFFIIKLDALCVE